MNKIDKLKGDLGVLDTERKEIEEKREASEGKEFTDEQSKRYDEILTRQSDLIGQIKTEQDREEKRNAVNGFIGDGEPKADPKVPVLDVRNNADEAEYMIGEFFQDVARRTIASKNGGVYNSPRLDMHQKRNLSQARENRATGMSEGIPSDGGFLVGTDYSKELIKKMHDTGVLKAKTRTIQVSGNSNSVSLPAVDETSRVNGSRWGGIRVYRLNEGGTKTASQPKFRRMDMALEKMIGLAYSSDELIQDASALGAFISEGFSEEFGFKYDDEIMNGTGAGQMLGILNSACLVTQAKETGQTAATIVYDNIVNMWSRMWAKSKPNSVWLVNSDVMPQIQKMSLAVGTGGSAVFTPPGGLSSAPYGTLMGRPIMEIEQAQTLGTVGDIVLADLSQYLTIEKGGMQSASSIHVQFTTDETAFRFVMRNNGQPFWNSALTPFKGSNTVSPFVALAARA